ncbi:MAG: hypothetical protein AB7O24_04950 [Kofleriaceae bacterium]
MTSSCAPAGWDDPIRRHDRNVYLSVLALGLPPDRARDIAQTRGLD